MALMTDQPRPRDAQGRYLLTGPIPPSSLIEEQKRRRAKEWRKFRKDFLYSQADLAEALSISRRTVVSVESGVVTPLPRIQRAFRNLVRQERLSL
jgi:DNA-binding XRE family transcriptional regulator